MREINLKPWIPLEKGEQGSRLLRARTNGDVGQHVGGRGRQHRRDIFLHTPAAFNPEFSPGFDHVLRRA